MLRNAKTIASIVAASAMLAAPAAGLAAKGGDSATAKSKTKHCTTKTHSVGYQVSGRYVSAIADDAATPIVNEASITLKVTSANSHAAKSGAIADQDAAKKGVQVKGATITVAATDAFMLKLHGYAGADTPSVGDKVKVSGSIKLTKKACAAASTSTADRYMAPDVKKLTLTDMDADA
jgi:hypothetical protein